MVMRGSQNPSGENPIRRHRQGDPFPRYRLIAHHKQPSAASSGSRHCHNLAEELMRVAVDMGRVYVLQRCAPKVRTQPVFDVLAREHADECTRLGIVVEPPKPVEVWGQKGRRQVIPVWHEPVATNLIPIFRDGAKCWRGNGTSKILKVLLGRRLRRHAGICRQILSSESTLAALGSRTAR